MSAVGKRGFGWLAIADPEQFVDAIVELFAARGGQHYDEAVTQTEHAAQSAELAAADGADDSLVAAALLHDVGHLLEPHDAGRWRDRDLRHERVGGRLLGRWFDPAVTEPIRLHVAAKRYLCSVDDGYHAELSEASVHSLELQGGPMSPDEVATFRRRPHHAEAARLRRWDDLAKRSDLISPPIVAYRPLLIGLCRWPQTPAGTAIG